MALDEKRIGFIGAGHITKIILDNLIKTEKLRSHRLIASDPEKTKLQQLSDKYKIVMANDNVEAVGKGDFIFINVPSQVVEDVIDELSLKRFPTDTLIITLVAAIWKVIVDEEPKSSVKKQLSIRLGHLLFGPTTAMDNFFVKWRPQPVY